MNQDSAVSQRRGRTSRKETLLKAANMLSDGVIRICFREECFQTRFFEPFRLVFLGALAGIEITTACMEGAQPLSVYLLWLPCWTLAASLPAVLLATRWFRYQVGPDGIEGYDFWGRSRTNWKSITRFRFVSLLGVEYLLVTGGSQRNVWVPLCVDRYDVLRRLLLTYADPRLELEHRLPESA